MPMLLLLQVSSSTPAERKESYKAQRKNYAKQKKRVGKELLSTFKDQSIIVLADWLKIRGSLKSWTKLWCIIKPGLLLIYRSQKAKVFPCFHYSNCSNCFGTDQSEREREGASQIQSFIHKFELKQNMLSLKLVQ